MGKFNQLEQLFCASVPAMLWHPSLQDIASSQGRTFWRRGRMEQCRELRQEHPLPGGGSRTASANGFGVGGSRGVMFTCRFTSPCLALAKALLPVERLSAWFQCSVTYRPVPPCLWLKLVWIYVQSILCHHPILPWLALLPSVPLSLSEIKVILVFCR